MPEPPPSECAREHWASRLRGSNLSINLGELHNASAKPGKHFDHSGITTSLCRAAPLRRPRVLGPADRDLPRTQMRRSGRPRHDGGGRRTCPINHWRRGASARSLSTGEAAMRLVGTLPRELRSINLKIQVDVQTIQRIRRHNVHLLETP